MTVQASYYAPVANRVALGRATIEKFDCGEDRWFIMPQLWRRIWCDGRQRRPESYVFARRVYAQADGAARLFFKSSYYGLISNVLSSIKHTPGRLAISSDGGSLNSPQGILSTVFLNARGQCGIALAITHLFPMVIPLCLSSTTARIIKLQRFHRR